MSDDELIARYVEVDPYHPGPGNVRLKESAVHVWAIIGHMRANDSDVRSTARDYDIPVVDVEAAVAFYRRFGWAIDARLAENSGWEIPVPAHVGD